MRTLSALFALALVGCGSGKDDTSSTTSPTGDPTTLPTTGTPGSGTGTGTGSGTGTGTGSTTDPDADGDGSPASVDCDDGDPARFPGNPEVCDGVDNDCVNGVDDGLSFSMWYLDSDGDGQGDLYAVVDTCDGPPAGYVNDGSDCDDGDPAVYFGATEVCDGVDNSCSGLVDDGLPVQPYWLDADGDGYGGETVTDACMAPVGWVNNPDDCDDADADSFPGATELCDAVDNDCDEVVDDGIALEWYADADGDGYGDSDQQVLQCPQPAGYVADWSDCDDGAVGVNPGVAEVCDGLDNNCNEATDEGVLLTWYTDVDQDGYGDPASPELACAQPAGTAVVGTDCDDSDATSYPGGTEVCDGADNDCANGVDDGAGSDWYTDGDGDGYGTTLVATGCAQPPNTADQPGDCDDTLASAYPGAPNDTCDLVDSDCDGQREEWIVPDDGSLAQVLGSTASGDRVCVLDPMNPGPFTVSTDVAIEGVGQVSLGMGAGPGITVASGVVVSLRNLTLEGSHAGGAYGGGLFLDNNAEATLSDVRILANTAETQGGGVYVSPDAVFTMTGGAIVGNQVTGDGSTQWTTGGAIQARANALVTLTDVEISSNVAMNGPGRYARGGAIGSDGAEVVLTDVSVWNNIAAGGTAQGGGLWIRNGSHIDALRLDVRGNEAQGDAPCTGGGLFLDNSSAVLENAIFAGNLLISPSTGTGAAVYSNGSVNASHLTLVNNGAETDGTGGAWYATGVVPIVDHVILQGYFATLSNGSAWTGNPPTLAYMSTFDNQNGDFAIPPTSPVGLMTGVDAGFVDLSGPPTSWDLHLSAGSALIDAGSGLDPDGSAADLGAYGGPNAVWP